MTSNANSQPTNAFVAARMAARAAALKTLASKPAMSRAARNAAVLANPNSTTEQLFSAGWRGPSDC